MNPFVAKVKSGQVKYCLDQIKRGEGVLGYFPCFTDRFTLLTEILLIEIKRFLLLSIKIKPKETLVVHVSLAIGQRRKTTFFALLLRQDCGQITNKKIFFF